MLRLSLSKIARTSLQCSKRGFSSKKSDKDWWNVPVNELNSSIINEQSSSKNVTVLPISSGSGMPSKVVAVADSTSGISFSNFQDTPCAEKKFSPCAEKKKPAPSPCPEKKPSNQKISNPCADTQKKSPPCPEKKKPKPKCDDPCAPSSSDSSDCSHHKSLVPPPCDLLGLESFELKSNCTTFHLKTEN